MSDKVQNAPVEKTGKADVKDGHDSSVDRTKLLPDMKEQSPGLDVKSNKPEQVANREEQMFGGNGGFSFDSVEDPFKSQAPKDGAAGAKSPESESTTLKKAPGTNVQDHGKPPGQKGDQVENGEPKKDGQEPKKDGEEPEKDGEPKKDGDELKKDDELKKVGDGTKKDQGGKPEEATPTEPITVLNDQSKFDPKKPTVAFLDDFKAGFGDPSANGPIAHGEFSAKGAESNGFNALRLQDNSAVDDKGFSDFSKSLNALNEGIENGTIKLGKGDVVNISMGNNVKFDIPGSGDPTFEEASKTFGLDINAGNLKDMRPQILDRAKVLANDPAQSEETRKSMQRIVDTNEAIKKLQDKGIEVVHAAGNDGDKRFSPDFLSADHHLAGVTSDGTPHKDSARHSLTEDAAMFTKVRFQPFDMMSPRLAADQQGSFTIGEIGAKIPAEEFGGRRLATDFRREVEPGSFVRTDPSMFSPEVTSNKLLGPEQKFQTVETDPKATVTEFKTHPQTFFTTKGTPNAFQMTPEEQEKGRIVSFGKGTSFGNIDWLAGQRDRLQKLKLEQ